MNTWAILLRKAWYEAGKPHDFDVMEVLRQLRERPEDLHDLMPLLAWAQSVPGR